MKRRDMLKLIPGFVGAIVMFPSRAWASVTGKVSEPRVWPDVLGELAKLRNGEIDPDQFWGFCIDFYHRCQAVELDILGRASPGTINNLADWKAKVPGWAQDELCRDVVAPLGYLYRCLVLSSEVMARTSFFDRALVEAMEEHPGLLVDESARVPVLTLQKHPPAIEMGEWRKRLETEISKWKADSNYVPIMPIFDFTRFHKFREWIGWTLEKAGMLNLRGADGHITRTEEDFRDMFWGLPDFPDNPYMKEGIVGVPAAAHLQRLPRAQAQGEESITNLDLGGKERSN